MSGPWTEDAAANQRSSSSCSLGCALQSVTLFMSQQPATSKPSLQGVRIKARKGAVKAQAKHEPTGITFFYSFTYILIFELVQYSETSSSNTLKPSTRAISTLIQQSSSRQAQRSSSSSMQMSSSSSSSSAGFSSQEAPMSMTAHQPHPSRSSTRTHQPTPKT